MPGPCPNGQPTQQLHAKCQDRGNCTGPGCRVHRAPYVDPIPKDLPDVRPGLLRAEAEQ